MGLKALLVALSVVNMVIVPTMSTDHFVGDDQGWKLKFDYNAWAESKEFHVGDKLIFKYKEGAHNVYKADLAAFQSCVPGANVEPLTSGNDVIDLKTPGKKWYFCGINNHCEQGMKVSVNVLEAKDGSSSSASRLSTLNSAFVAAFVMFLIAIA